GWLCFNYVIQNLFDYRGIFNAGDDLNAAAALITDFDSHIEHTLSSLRPCHRCSAFLRGLILGVVSRVELPAFAPFAGCYPRSIFTVGRKAAPSEHTMESSEVYLWLWNQRGQF
ncbi:MAG: hypothetical protein ACI9OI_001534, partial [Chitinophagales bacterium]